ncbi:MAG TPA: hypothetical protein VK095_00540 [Beutenbergiaceae bacterium]|nr:hypothetical protein [Beutenbergiaceae bacterium]
MNDRNRIRAGVREGGQFATQPRTEAEVSLAGGFSPGEVEQVSTKADKDGYQVPVVPDFMPEPTHVSWEPVGGSVEVNLYFPDGSYISAWSHDGDLQHTMDDSYDIIGGRPQFLTEVSGPERRKREQEAEKSLWSLHGRIEAGHLQAEEIAAAKTHDLILSAALGPKEDA